MRSCKSSEFTFSSYSDTNFFWRQVPFLIFAFASKASNESKKHFAVDMNWLYICRRNLSMWLLFNIHKIILLLLNRYQHAAASTTPRCKYSVLSQQTTAMFIFYIIHTVKLALYKFGIELHPSNWVIDTQIEKLMVT